jgi:NADPH:quinone reductase-like Zn-dependent oxidoreductase
MTRTRKVRLFAVALVAIGVISLAWLVSYEDPCTPAPSPGDDVATMKAAVHRCYGGPEVIELVELEKPVPAEGELLVRVEAAAANPLDYHYLRGKPYVMRIESGLGTPRSTRLGVDFAGTVEAVGAGVTRFSPGDAVFGGRTGAFAEYVVVREDRAVVAKPAGVSFEQAAAVPIAGLTALQGLRDRGGLEAGDKVLVNGASGGVGTFAVQIQQRRL